MSRVDVSAVTIDSSLHLPSPHSLISLSTSWTQGSDLTAIWDEDYGEDDIRVGPQFPLQIYDKHYQTFNTCKGDLDQLALVLTSEAETGSRLDVEGCSSTYDDDGAVYETAAHDDEEYDLNNPILSLLIAC